MRHAPDAGASASPDAAPRRAPLIGPFGRKAIRAGRIANIEVGFDLSWIFVFALVTIALAGQFAAEHEAWSRPEAWAAGLVAALLFFLSILLHELGHSLTSNLLGIPVRSITLFVFGGLAQLAGKPGRPRDEFLIGMAGPAVSVVLGALFLGIAALVPETAPLGEPAVAIFGWLGFVNLALAAFNLFPGHPLDGGHVLRAAVWAATGDERRGTAAAAAMGTAFALLLIGVGAVMVVFAGAIGGFWLVLIGWFVMRASQGSVLQEMLQERLSRVAVREAMVERCPRVGADETVEALISDAILKQGQRHFCVERDGELAGLVTLNELKSVAPAERATTRVAAIMIPRERLQTIAGDDSLWDALGRMDDLGVNQLPVVRDAQLVGLLTREQLLRVIRNQLDFARSA
jgi:Zn-dependent protease